MAHTVESLQCSAALQVHMRLCCREASDEVKTSIAHIHLMGDQEFPSAMNVSIAFRDFYSYIL